MKSLFREFIAILKEARAEVPLAFWLQGAEPESPTQEISQPRTSGVNPTEGRLR